MKKQEIHRLVPIVNYMMKEYDAMFGIIKDCDISELGIHNGVITSEGDRVILSLASKPSEYFPKVCTSILGQYFAFTAEEKDITKKGIVTLDLTTVLDEIGVEYNRYYIELIVRDLQLLNDFKISGITLNNSEYTFSFISGYERFYETGMTPSC